MPARIFDEITNWANGANTSASPDQIPVGASPRARNTVLKSIGDDTALMGKRLGATTLNSTPVTGSPGLWGFQFKKRDGSKYNLLKSDTGRLDKLNTDGTLTNISTALTSGDHVPHFAVAKDLCFIVTDSDQKKYDGTNLRNFGITRPSAPTATAAAGGAMAAGVWDVVLTYYNSATGHESSRSDATSVTLSGGNLKINVSWSAPADAQVTHVRVYVRQQTAGPNFYRAIAGATPAPDATHGGYAPATTSTVLDISANQYSAFTLLAPNTNENDPPASGLKFPVWHNSRLFLFDSGNAYYSTIRDNAPYPEAFDPNAYQPVNPDDGDSIIGAASYGGRLLIFKRFSLWQIIGDDPTSWTVEKITDTPCSSMSSIVEADGVLYWWGGHLGLIAYTGSGAPLALGKKFLSNSITDTELNENGLGTVVGGVHENTDTVLMAVPEFGSTRNTRLIPFNYRLGRFHAEYWTPFDVKSLWVVETSDDLKALYMGGYEGQAFSWWTAANDGVPVATTQSGSVTSSTNNTLTASAATFATAGGGLVGRYVYAISSDRLSIQRRRITSNTATQLTISQNWTTNPNDTYTFVVGGIDFQLDTAWITNPSVFFKKRYEFIFIEAASSDVGVTLDVDIFTSMDDSEPKKRRSITLGSGGGLYDDVTATYDATEYASNEVTLGKIRAGCVGHAWKVRLRNLRPDQDLLVYKISVQGQALGINR